jgi:hypothetical protein
MMRRQLKKWEGRGRSLDAVVLLGSQAKMLGSRAAAWSEVLDFSLGL